MQKYTIVKERLALEITCVIPAVMHTNISKYLDDQEIMLSANKEGTLVTVTPKNERKVRFH